MPVSVSVIDVLGNTLFAPEELQPSADNLFTLNFSTLPRGVYFVKVRYADIEKIERIVVR